MRGLSGVLAGAVVWLLAADGFAQSKWDDPRLAQWAAAANGDRWEAAIDLIEKDLRSAKPHPFGPFAWVEAHEVLGSREAACRAVAEPVATAVKTHCDIAADEETPRKVMDRFAAPEVAKMDMFAASRVLWSVDAIAGAERLVDYGLAVAVAQPDNLMAAWMVRQALRYESRGDSPLRARVRDAVTTGPLKGQPLGRLIDRMVIRTPVADVHEDIAALKEWLVVHPNDSMAHRLIAYQYRDLFRHEPAAEHFQSAWSAFPFYATENVLREAVDLVHLERFEEAEARAGQYARIRQRTAKTAAATFSQYWASALREAGERGRARDVLVTAVAKWPEDGGLAGELCGLERDSRRYPQAIEACTRALAGEPGSASRTRDLAHALRLGGKPSDALALFEAYRREEPEKVTPELYAEAFDALDAVGRKDELVPLMDEAVERFPDSAWMLRVRALAFRNAGAASQAVAALEKAMESDPFSDWIVDRLIEWAPAEQLDPMLVRWRKRWPEVAKVWIASAERMTDHDKRVALWREAMRLNPDVVWPVFRLAVEFMEDERFSDAARELEAMLSSLPKDAPAGMRPELHLDLAHVVKRKIQVKGGATADEIRAAEQHIEKFRELGGADSTYYYQVKSLFEAAGRDADAALAAVSQFRHNPDSVNAFWTMVRMAPKLRDRGLQYQAMDRFLRRDPYDGERLKALMDFHVRWHGSPVVGLRIGQWIEDRAPNYDVADLKGHGYAALGDDLSRFEQAYARASSISPSRRYVNWYENTRRGAQGDSTRVLLDPDPAKMRASIEYLDGRVLVREDHPISGKVQRLEVGTAWIRYEYDQWGARLQLIERSNGTTVRLAYEGVQITELEVREAGKVVDTLSFEFEGPKDPRTGEPKMSRISVRGIGRLDVSYGEPDSADAMKTAAFDARGRPVESSASWELSRRITGAMDRLLSLVRPASGREDAFAMIPHTDQRLYDLQDAWHGARRKAEDAFLMAHPNHPYELPIPLDQAAIDAGLKLAKYLGERVREDPANAEEARFVLSDLLWATDTPSASSKSQKAAVEAARTLHSLYSKTRPVGLTRTEHAAWNEVLDRLRRMGTPDARRAVTVFESEPLPMMQRARWLPRHDLIVEGYWRRYTDEEVLPVAAVGAPMRTILVRANRDVVVGSEKGLSVLRRGFWEWFGLDAARGRFDRDANDLRANSHVLSLAEDTDGGLWIGTADGLYRLRGDDYGASPEEWRSENDGLPTPRIDHLAVVGEHLYLGTPKGLRTAASGGPVGLPADAPEDVTSSEVLDLEGSTSEPSLLVATARGLFLLRNGRWTRLAEHAVDSAALVGDENRVLFQKGTSIHEVLLVDGLPTRLLDSQDVVVSKRIHGLSSLPVDAGRSVVSVATDQGLSLYGDHHFEHLDLPDFSIARVGVQAVSARIVGGDPATGRVGRPRLGAITSQGVYVFQRDQALGDTAGRVNALLTLDDYGVTLVARESGLDWVSHEDAERGAVPLNGTRSRHLVRAPDGSVVLDDWDFVLSFDPETLEIRELFQARETRPPDSGREEDPSITSLLVQDDGTIWATAGASVFRYSKGKVEEFNALTMPEKFPARSHYVDEVFETIDGRVLVVASNESHLNYRGMVLSGGVVEWDGQKFKRIDLEDKTEEWFVTGYTRVDDETALVGTSSGFARHRNGKWSAFDKLEDPTYQALKTARPQLFLGTRGARLGDVWLFGTGGGLVAWEDGRWFYPDRINWMLPDQWLEPYGARKVHAVATDRQGRIYAGTDRGLLIADTGGEDPVSFLASNRQFDKAFQQAELEKLREQADIMLSRLDPASKVGKQVAEIRKLREEMDTLRRRLEPVEYEQQARSAQRSGTDGDGGEPTRTDGGDSEERKAFEKRFEERSKRHRAILHALEREEPGVYQLLELKPLDLVALRKKMEEGQVIVQYLPAAEKLYIQVVTKDRVTMREVAVERDELLRRGRLVADRIAGRQRSSRRGFVVHQLLGDSVDLTAELAWLYQNLLAPVESEIDGADHVFVVPIGALTYVPFGALVRRTEPAVEYAVERYDFGYVNSLYLFELMYQNFAGGSGQPFVLGDPDGSLPGARKEAERVAELLSADGGAVVGDAATLERVQGASGRANVLHLATHGVLHHQRPEQSYLLMAGKRRLYVLDAEELNLQNTELVVLSACESGLGTTGLEYATLARAFMHAGASSIVATLWQIEDQSSRLLMEKFYANLAEGKDRLTALNDAQRALLKHEDPELREPWRWAGYIAFGRP